MKKVKAICRNIIIFVVAMGVSILPTMFRTEDEMNTLFREPEYWVISAFIAAIVTWQVVQEINKSQK